ncbi:MAG: desulfoferrodoxin family protein [Anaerovoracaceae bacterium]|jgi:superoxide reductase
MLQIYKCDICGNIFIVGYKSAATPQCCGQPMTLVEPNTVDAAQEKHVPVVTVNGDKVEAKVGSVEHPMTDEHYIASIILETDRSLQVKYMRPTDKPEASFVVAPGEKPVAVYEYCTLHGLWKADI